MSVSLLHELVEAQVRRTPGAVAVVHGALTLTYQELDVRAEAMAARLRSLGVGAEVIVGVRMQRSLDLVVALLGVLKAGGAYLPLDPAYPAERLEFMLADAHAAVLITDDGLQPIAGAHTPGEGEPRPASLAYVIYTSGSTGRPKGVQIAHHNAVAFIDWAIHFFSAAELRRVLASTSVCFDLSIFELFAPLSVGGSVVLVKDALQLATTTGTAHDISLLNTVPSALRELLHLDAIPSGVRTINVAGEPLARSLVDEAYGLAHIERVVNLYGPTEDTTYSTVAVMHAGDTAAPSIGCPIAGTSVAVLDVHLELVGAGEAGELYIGGEGLARGYLGRPDLTAERFIPDPFSSTPGARLYRTGDRVRWRPDGQLEFLGRVDRQIKLRGFRIELGEIEAALSALSGIKDGVVLLREDVVGQPRLVAYVTPRGAALEPAELRSALGRNLPEYMLPTSFVQLAAMPLTPNGKIDRAALPAPVTVVADAALEPPVTDTERLVADIWRDVLHLPFIARSSNFFDLGGNSLLAARVIHRVRTARKVELPLHILFDHPTVVALAARVETADTARAEFIASRAAHAARVAASNQQQQLWLSEQLTPGTAMFNVPCLVQLDGPLDLAALQAALQSIVDRHEILRTTLSSVDGQPLQVISAQHSVRLPLVDVRSPSAASQLAQRIARRPFDLQRGPLFRARLLRLAPDQHWLVLVFHHIVTDGWSLGIFFDELAALYGGTTTADLPALPIQYADYADWQRQQLHGSTRERLLAYWREQLAGAPTVLELPSDRPRPAVRSARGATTSFDLPADLRAQLEQLARAEGATLYMVLLAGFAALLQRLTGRDDLLIGSPLANRPRPETEALIGFFVNTLPLRVSPAQVDTFRTLLRQVRTTTLGALAHQELPLEQLVEALQPQRDPSRTPLVQVVFALQGIPLAPRQLDQLTLVPSEMPNGSAKFDLVLEITPRADGLTGRLEYSTDLFEASTMQRVARQLGTLLTAAVAAPDNALTTLSVIDPVERDQLLIEWNSTRQPFDDTSCVPERIAAIAANTPNALAVNGSRAQLTYAELNRRATQFAQHLRRLGVGPEVVVGVCLERTPDLVVALLGVLHAGGAYLPIDPNTPAERVRYMLDDAHVSVLITQSAFVDKLGDLVTHTVCVERDPLPSSSEILNVHEGRATPRNLAYVIYTSGSTGRPKGVQIEHRSLLNLIAWHRRAFDVSPRDRASMTAGLAFDASVWELWPYLAAGASVHLPDETTRSTPTQLRDWLAEREITIGFVSTPMAEELMALAWPSGVHAPRLLLTGGDALHRVPDADTPFRLINNYGPTECTVVTISGDVPPVVESGSPSLGRPISNFRVYVLGADLAVLPTGVPGELYIGGEGLARGYLGRPDLTAERFIPDPFSSTPGARLYRTGDRVRWRPDGQLEFLGRVDRQIKLRGFRIELGEIEAALSALSGIKDGVVLLREDVVGQPRLVAYVTPRGAALEPAELRSALGRNLPEYMLPTSFVQLAAMPLTPNGKIDRAALPAPVTVVADAALEPPVTDTERLVADIWSNVLGRSQVGRFTSFFELGGHSLAAMQVTTRVRDALGVNLSVTSLFEQPTLALCAAAIDDLTSKAGSDMTRIVPIARAQRRVR